jgi:hypothetical protein
MISPSGNEALLLLAVRQGFVKPCFSDEILEEYSGRAAASEIRFCR